MLQDNRSAGESTGHAGDVRWELVDRILLSDQFRRSPRLRQFLSFIVTKSLSGHTEDISEYEIGTAVFQKGKDFNAHEDSIVRSTARLLRLKIHEYFQEEGKDETLVIDIPKGSYLPVFRERAQAIHLSPPAQPDAPPVGASYLASRWPWVVVSGLLAVLCAWLALRPGAPEARAPTRNLVVELFARDPAATTIVVCDSWLVLRNQLAGDMASIDEYVSPQYLDPLPGVPQAANSASSLKSRYWTPYADFSFALRLKSIPLIADKLMVRHSRQMQASDFRTGNAILIGSPFSNPWFSLFEDGLNFRFEKDPDTGRFGYRNCHLKAGERDFYWSTPESSRDGRSYARVALLPNLAGNGRVLLVSGLRVEESEAAADFVFSEDSLDRIGGALGSNRVRDSKYFELLLESHATQGAVRGVTPIAYSHLSMKR